MLFDTIKEGEKASYDNIALTPFAGKVWNACYHI